MPALVNFSAPEPQIETAVTHTEPVAAPSLKQLIKDKAQEIGVDSRVAARIAFCESTYRQFDSQGRVLRGKANPKDVGVFQINEKFHKDQSESLGFDIYTTEGNIDYALWLIKNEGSRHWKWSRPCWIS